VTDAAERDAGKQHGDGTAPYGVEIHAWSRQGMTTTLPRAWP
jgi:hypothetical protein